MQIIATNYKTKLQINITCIRLCFPQSLQFELSFIIIVILKHLFNSKVIQTVYSILLKVVVRVVDFEHMFTMMLYFCDFVLVASLST